MDATFEYVFPAIRGIQAKREYYVSMCPLKLIPKIFLFDEEELTPEMRAQRILNMARVPKIARYIVENKDSYVFSAITASINGDVRFTPLGERAEQSRIGTLHVDMNSQFIINDGQHRRAAIEEALKADPSLSDETISVVFFVDRGLERCQQMFADLNLYQVKTSRSIGILYDQRNDAARIAKFVAMQSSAFKDLVDMERTSLSRRSRKLFTLSAIHQANNALLNSLDCRSTEDAVKASIEFWNTIGEQMPEWQQVRALRISAGEIRDEYVHPHSITLQAIGMAGAKLYQESPSQWLKKLILLRDIDWRRSNSSHWEGRCMLAGRMSKASQNISLTANLIKEHLGLELSPEEKRLEDAFHRGDNV